MSKCSPLYLLSPGIYVKKTQTVQYLGQRTCNDLCGLGKKKLQNPCFCLFFNSFFLDFSFWVAIYLVH